MCYNFFRPLVESYDGKMYKPKNSLLNLIGMEIDQEIEPHGAVCNFEYIDDSAENTNFDFYFKKGDIEVFFEIKYTEREFSKKSSAKAPHAQYEVIYKPMIEKTKELFIGETISEQDFNNEYYQLARNSIRATSANKHVFFVCPKEHEELINQFVEFSDKYLTEKGKERIKLITWEDLVQDAYRLGINVAEFANRYLAFMP